LGAITGYTDDSEDDSEEKHAHNREKDDEKDNNDDTASKSASHTNFARRINRIWLDVHNIIPRTDPGLFIPGMPTNYSDVEEDSMIGPKHSHPDVGLSGPSKVRIYSFVSFIDWDETLTLTTWGSTRLSYPFTTSAAGSSQSFE